MQGSLDQPPIVIHGSRWKTAVIGCIALGFTAAATAILWSDEVKGDVFDRAMLQFAFLFFAGLSLVSLCRLIWPNRLTLGAGGFDCDITWLPGFKQSYGYSWGDIAELRAGRMRGFAVVQYKLTKKTKPRGSQMRLRPLRIDNQLLPGWEISAAKLVELMQQARQRWS